MCIVCRYAPKTWFKLDFDLSSVKVALDFPYVVSYLLVFISNIGPNLAPLQDIKLQNLCDFDFDLSKSLKVKCDSAIGLPIYGFLLMFNNNIGPN